MVKPEKKPWSNTEWAMFSGIGLASVYTAKKVYEKLQPIVKESVFGATVAATLKGEETKQIIDAVLYPPADEYVVPLTIHGLGKVAKHI